MKKTTKTAPKKSAKVKAAPMSTATPKPAKDARFKKTDRGHFAINA